MFESRRNKILLRHEIQIRIRRSGSEPERRAQHRAAQGETLNEIIAFLAVVEVPVGQRHVAPTVGVNHTYHRLPSVGG